ncbi:MAG: ABC transporter ATP-binding protein [Deltaproteobacteria bacterium]|nr:ABC transporter ATP-binding protein [Deltaproteobacteria bacterium]
MLQYTRRGLSLVWQTSGRLAVAMAVATVVAGVLPGAIAWVGRHVIDAVLRAASGDVAARASAERWVLVELMLVLAMGVTSRAIALFRTLLRQLLGQRTNVVILEKALQLSLTQFEDAGLYDKLTRARREASQRPLSLATQSFELAQQGLTLLGLVAILLTWSVWILPVILLASLPLFIAELSFSTEQWKLSRFRTPESREQMYLETLMAREDHAKEMKLLDLGPTMLARYQAIFDKMFPSERALSLRRALWGMGLSLVGTAAFYGTYLVLVRATMRATMTIGAMSMYALAFKHAQTALSAGLASVGAMVENNLYLSNLYEFLDTPTEREHGGDREGPSPRDGVRFEDVSFCYPDAKSPALEHVTLHIAHGARLAIVGENGSGKTTLIKLLCGLYQPTEGRILLDGLDLRAWEPAALRRKVAMIFQDFVRYQLTVGENIGAGDATAYTDRERWDQAAQRAMAKPVIDGLPEGYDTRLGKWFKGGRELSLGQWQKVALARAFFRRDADVLVLDEPTASMDAEAEVQIFERFREQTQDKIAIVISHRFSTVRMADEIVVLDHGRVLERGTHEELVALGGRYATLFALQAQGYR